MDSHADAGRMLTRHRKRQRQVPGALAPTAAVIGEPLAATSYFLAPEQPSTAAAATVPARAVAAGARTTTPAAAAAAADTAVTSRIIQGHTTTTTPARVATTPAAVRASSTTSAPAAASPTTPSTAARVATLSSSSASSSSSPSASTTASKSNSSSSSSSGISGGAAAGIVIAVLAVLALVAGAVFYRRRKAAARQRLGSGQRLFDTGSSSSPDFGAGSGSGKKAERETGDSVGVFGGSSASPGAAWDAGAGEYGNHEGGEKAFYGGYGATQQQQQAQNPFNNPPAPSSYGAMIPPHHHQQPPYPPSMQQHQGWPAQQQQPNPSSVNLLAPAAVAAAAAASSSPSSFADPHYPPSIEQREMQQELDNRAQAQAQGQGQVASPFAESDGQGEIRVVKGTFDPSLDDELVLYAGDCVQVLMKYDDGWALGLNLNSGRPPAKGVFPYDCLGEVCPPPPASAVRSRQAPGQAQGQRALSPPVPSALQPGSPHPQPQPQAQAPVNPALIPLPPPTPTSLLAPISELAGGEGPPQLAPLALDSSDSSPLSASFAPHVQSIPAHAATTMKRASSLIASRDADLFVALGEVMEREGKEGNKGKSEEQQGPSLL